MHIHLSRWIHSSNAQNFGDSPYELPIRIDPKVGQVGIALLASTNWMSVAWWVVQRISVLWRYGWFQGGDQNTVSLVTVKMADK
jgi:hypothetical protein